jgi:hypothetical protein
MTEIRFELQTKVFNMQLHSLNSNLHSCAARRVTTAVGFGAISTKQSLTQRLQCVHLHNGEK